MIAPPPGDDDQEWDDLPLFARHSDPSESKDAAKRIEAGRDRREVFYRFAQLIADIRYFPTRKVLEFEFLIELGYDPVRADSLTRRLSDIVERPRNPFPKELHLLRHSGERYNGAAILTFTERGIKAVVDPRCMIGVWGLRKRKDGLE